MIDGRRSPEGAINRQGPGAHLAGVGFEVVASFWMSAVLNMDDGGVAECLTRRD